jgi:hypothetical protein
MNGMADSFLLLVNNRKASNEASGILRKNNQKKQPQRIMNIYMIISKFELHTPD